MRRILFWGGWVLLLFYAVFYAVQIYLIQDIPRIELYKWGILFATGVLIYAARDRREVTELHLPH